MEFQTERLETQQARLTVAIANDRLESAKKAAARRLSKRNDIRGFRKGKAPYPIVLRHFGEAVIVEEALEALGNEVYREAISQSDLLAYGPGTLEDFSLQPEPQFTFTLPLQPEVDLHNYREQRLDFEEPIISDEDLAQQLKSLRFQNAVFEESRGAVATGDRVSIDYHVTFADDPDRVVESDDDNDDAEETPLRGSDFARGEEQTMWLDDEEEPLLPGFRAALLGAALDEEREFTLTVPDEARYRRDIVGRTVDCHIKIRKIDNVTLPEMNDAFAANLTKDENEPLTLLQLRQRIRENMQSQASEQARAAYIQQVQEAILTQASIRYPEAMLADETQARLEQFANDLQQRYNLKLDDYQRIQGTSDEELRAEFRPDAQRGLESWLLRDAIRAAEGITVTTEMIAEEIERIFADLGERADKSLRAQYQAAEMQTRIANGLLQRQIDERLFAIGRGQAPNLTHETEHDLSPTEEGESAT